MTPFHRFTRAGAAFCAAASFPLAAAAQSSIAPAVERAARGLVHVSVLFEAQSGSVVRVERSSSGFVIDARGLVLTNEHLVDEIPTGGGEPGGEYWLQVVSGDFQIYDAKVVARDERLDLALLELALSPGDLVPALELAPGPAPAPGADVFAVGRPRGGHWFALAGTVAGASGPVTLRAGKLEASELLISDAAVLDYVDGAPFVDRRGLVLGIVNTVQRNPYDLKAEDSKPQNDVDYAVAVCAQAIRSAFPDRFPAPGDTAKAQAAEDPSAAIVRTAAPAVVSVWAGADDARPRESALNDPYAKKGGKGLGSGVVVDPAGLVLTTADLVGEEKEVGVRLLDGRSFRAQVLRAVPEGNVALLRIPLPEGVRLQAVPLGSSGAALAGESITVIGNPYGHTPTVSAGVLSALEVEQRLRVGAWVHDGHKGGALLDSTGRLIGIASANLLEGEEQKRGESYLGVALPIDRVRTWLAGELEQHAAAPGLRAAPAAEELERARREDTVTKIVAETRDSLLNVEIKAEAPRAAAFDPFGTPGELKLLGHGSGVVIDESGLAITNWHVTQPTLAEDGSQRSDRGLEVTLPSGRRYTARVLATSRDDDLALIQLELPEGESVRPVPLGATKSLRRGDITVAIGNPYGKANSVTVGIVAAKDQDVNIQGRLHVYQDMLQTDAAINPGNSGGALLDLEGRLVGINSAGSSGVGMAIPVERVREVFGSKLLATMGPFLGISVEDAPGGGVAVSTVDEHGPAEAAGVKEEDLLRAVDGVALPTTVDYGNLLLARRSAASMKLELERAGQRLEVEVRPVSQAVWRAFRQTGLEVAELDYAAESGIVREASIALHRAYTGLVDGQPSRLMGGALRVKQVQPHGARVLDVKPGDLLLGASSVQSTVDAEQVRLVRFESVESLRDFLEPLASKEGSPAQCWLLRDGKVIQAQVRVFRAR